MSWTGREPTETHARLTHAANHLYTNRKPWRFSWQAIAALVPFPPGVSVAERLARTP
jgi:hypothetical protein